MSLQMWGLLIAAVLIISVAAVKILWPAYKDDNPIEEAAEKIIKDTTGVDVDLTPGSQNKSEQSAISSLTQDDKSAK